MFMFLLVSDLDRLNRRIKIEISMKKKPVLYLLCNHGPVVVWRCLTAGVNFSGKFALSSFFKLWFHLKYTGALIAFVSTCEVRWFRLISQFNFFLSKGHCHSWWRRRSCFWRQKQRQRGEGQNTWILFRGRQGRWEGRWERERGREREVWRCWWEDQRQQAQRIWGWEGNFRGQRWTKMTFPTCNDRVFRVDWDQICTSSKHTVANFFICFFFSGEKKDDEPEKMDTTPVTDEKKGLYHLNGSEMIT